MNELYQPADPAARRNAIILILAMSCLGIWALFAVDRYVDSLRELSKDDPLLAVERVAVAMRALAIVLSCLLSLFAAWLFRLSLRTQRAQRFPPPGTRVIRDTKVLIGEAARARAMLGYGLATIVFSGGIALAVILWRFTESLIAMSTGIGP